MTMKYVRIVQNPTMPSVKRNLLFALMATMSLHGAFVEDYFDNSKIHIIFLFSFVTTHEFTTTHKFTTPRGEENCTFFESHHEHLKFSADMIEFDL